MVLKGSCPLKIPDDTYQQPGRKNRKLWELAEVGKLLVKDCIETPHLIDLLYWNMEGIK